MDRQKLIDAGVDYDEGVERFGGQAQMYEKYLLKFFGVDLMSQIEQKLESRDIEGAFRVTHDLKGVAGNLSLNRFFDAVCDLTEKLRTGKSDADFDKQLKAAQESYKKAKNAVEETKQ